MTSRGSRPIMAVLVVAGILAGAGCAAAPAPAARHAAVQTTSERRATAAAARSAARAAAVGRRILAEVALPAGSRRIQRLPARIRSALSGGNVDTAEVYAAYELPVSASMARRILSAHWPPGMRNSGYGPEPGWFFLLATPTYRLPKGIWSIQLNEAFFRGTRASSQVLVYVDVTWIPPRSPDQMLTAARFRAIRITITDMRSPGRPVTTSSRAFIAAAVRLLDAFPAQPGPFGPWCDVPAGPNYALLFEPAVAGQPSVVVTAGTDCTLDFITVGRQQQSGLTDANAALASLTSALLRRSQRA
jgi:hypothetical protein